MTTADLLRRGFVEHWRLGKFHTYCPTCGRYQLFAWWAVKQGPEWHKTETVACVVCGTVDARDTEWIERLPVSSSPYAAEITWGLEPNFISSPLQGTHSGQPGPKARGREGIRATGTRVWPSLSVSSR